MIRPFDLVNCADLGDVGPNPADIADTMSRITSFYQRLIAAGIMPMTAGGDHLASLPVLRAVADTAPVAMIHFDSHTDLFHSYFGGTLYTHGTPFRRAVEEELLIPQKVVQIGIRGTQYDHEDLDFAKAVGIRVIKIEEFHQRGVAGVMAEARDIVGADKTYISYDIDFVDPTLRRAPAPLKLVVLTVFKRFRWYVNWPVSMSSGLILSRYRRHLIRRGDCVSWRVDYV